MVIQPPDKDKSSAEEQSAQEAVPRITCEELKRMMDEGVDLVVVDTRWEGSYKRGPRIKGAVNIPGAAMPPMTEQIIEIKLMALPWDKTIVFYCDCADDSESTMLALKLIETGFDAEKVKVLTKAWPRWVEMGYPVDK
jgi:rhodanese-related sulfurtransferase